MLLSDYIFQVQQLVHDSAGIDYQTSELTAYINEARARVAADFYCIRTYFTNLSTQFAGGSLRCLASSSRTRIQSGSTPMS